MDRNKKYTAVDLVTYLCLKNSLIINNDGIKLQTIFLQVLLLLVRFSWIHLRVLWHSLLKHKSYHYPSTIIITICNREHVIIEPNVGSGYLFLVLKKNVKQEGFCALNLHYNRVMVENQK